MIFLLFAFSIIFLLDVQAEAETDAVVATSRVAEATNIRVSTANFVTTSPTHARKSITTISVTRVFCCPFLYI